MDTKYNGQMQNNTFLGAPTPAKCAGVAFSFSALLAPVLAFAFLFVLGACGVKEGYDQQNWYLYIAYFLPQLAFALVALWCLRFAKRPFGEVCKSQKCSVKYILVALLLQVGLFALSELNTLFLKLLGTIGYEDAGMALPSLDGFGFVGTLVVVALLPALFEEIIFRGILLNGLKSFGRVGAVLLCGALFALYHQNPAQTLYQFCCGASFALVALRAGSVLPTIVAHFINNATILTLTKLGITSISGKLLWILIPVFGVCLLSALGYLIFIDKRPALQTEKAEKKNFFKYASVGIAVCALSWLVTLVSGL